MRYMVLALGLCFALSPMEAKTRSNTHGVKSKKNKVKGHKAPKPKVHRNTAN